MCDGMVERVARAIVENPPEERQETTDNGWRIVRDYGRTARAAIEAMREPTDAMLDSMDWYSAGTASDILWEAGIDAALNEQVA